MKNRPTSRGLSDLIRHIQGRDAAEGMPGSAKPESEGERAEGALMNILRWEDDGGQILDLRPLRDSLEKQVQNRVMLKRTRKFE